VSELCADLGLVLGTYVIIAVATVWFVCALFGAVEPIEPDHPTSGQHHSRSEEVIR
jgi:hypothetical protein